MGKNQTLASVKKQYVKALIEQGDIRSYNEIQADLELELWEQRFKSIHEVAPALVEEQDNLESSKTE